MLLYSNSIRSNNSNHPMIFLWKSTNCKTPPNHPDSEVQVGQTLDQLSPKTRWHTGRHWTLSQPLDLWAILYYTIWIASEKRSWIKFWFGQFKKTVCQRVAVSDWISAPKHVYYNQRLATGHREFLAAIIMFVFDPQGNHQ